MKISTGKTARGIRRREISTRLLDIIDKLSVLKDLGSSTKTERDALVPEARGLILELHEISAIDANQPTKLRRRTN